MVKFSDEWIVRNFTEKGFEVKRGRLTQLPREGYWVTWEEFTNIKKNKPL
jgi:hypothetical protein